MYPLIPEQVFFILEQERRQRLSEAERARLLREHSDGSIVSLSWAEPLVRAWSAVTAGLIGLVRNLSVRPVGVGGEETPAEG
jgi:hypothetical protein